MDRQAGKGKGIQLGADIAGELEWRKENVPFGIGREDLVQAVAVLHLLVGEEREIGIDRPGVEEKAELLGKIEDAATEKSILVFLLRFGTHGEFSEKGQWLRIDVDAKGKNTATVIPGFSQA